MIVESDKQKVSCNTYVASCFNNLLERLLMSDNFSRHLLKSGEYASKYLKLYMEKCHRDFDKNLKPVHCLLVMIDRVSRDIPNAYKSMKNAKQDMIEVIDKVFNELDTKKVH
jgi:hypothetical protein